MTNEHERQITLFDAIQQMAKLGAWELDIDSGSLYWSEQTYQIHDTSDTQYTPCLNSAQAFCSLEWKTVLSQAFNKAIKFGIGFDLEVEIITAKNRRKWVHIYCSVLLAPQKPIKLIGAIQDIDQIKNTQSELEKSEFLFRSLFDLGNTGLAITSPEKGWVKVNPMLTDILGYSEQELFCLNWAELTYPDDLQADVEQFEQMLSGAIDNYRMDKRFIHKDGSIIHVLLTVACYRKKDHVEYVIASLEDITERKISEQKIQRLAHYDCLTGLPNRLLAEARFEHALQSISRSGEMVCVMFLDLDEFKTINDSLGHGAGDAFLVEIAERLKSITRQTDTVCRQGGDEFLVILESIKSEQQLLNIAEKVLQKVKQPYRINGICVSTSVSIGLAIAPNDGDNFESICRHSDMAMYQAKNAGRNTYHFYNTELENKAENRIQRLSDLRTAISENQFELFYQPKINLSTGTIIGAEALIRWRHPITGIISPINFISLAESSGQIVELGRWILEEACRNCKQWQQDGLRDLSVAVNVSAIQFKRKDFFHIVELALIQSKLSASQLELELTESLLIDDTRKSTELFSKLNLLGIAISIDDFGTGYSNLGYLKRMNINTLKIDRSFVSKLLTDDQDKAIIEAILHMATSLQIKVVAEGVEDEATLSKLKSLNCEQAQGYYWSKPLCYSDFVDYAKNHQTTITMRH